MAVAAAPQRADEGLQLPVGLPLLPGRLPLLDRKLIQHFHSRENQLANCRDLAIVFADPCF